MMIISNILYPFSYKEVNWIQSVQNKFMTVDFFDMAELIFSDIGCYISYGGGWLTAFFVATGASAMLSTTRRGLEQAIEEGEVKTWFDCFVTILNMIFSDIMFCVLRIYVIEKEGQGHGHDFIFLMKEFVYLSLRIALIVSYIVEKNSFPL